MKNSLRIHKWTHNEFNIFILGVLTHPQQDPDCFCKSVNCSGSRQVYNIRENKESSYITYLQ